MDYLIYGQCFILRFKPNIFQKAYRWLLGLPINEKRLHPAKVRLCDSKK
jgi:hypothetical protein